MQADEVEISAADVRLSGTVWAPDRREATSGLVLIGGSGPADRSNGGYFDALRDALVNGGVAVLAYDKRGVGRSTGSWASAGVSELAADAAAAINALRAHPGVDPSGVGLFGHSEGGWVALRVCADGAAACHLVLNSCPAVSFVEAEVHALVTAGVAGERGRAAFQRLRAAAHANADLATAAQVIAHEQDPLLRDILDRVGFRLTDESWAQLRAWIDYTPDGDLDRLRTPTLAIFGTQDPLTPVQASVDRLTSLTPTVSSQVFAGADHRLFVNGALAPGYLDALTAWCTSQGPAAHRPARR